MAVTYTSKLFTSVEDFSSTVKENVKKAQSFADDKTAPVKGYVESVQSVLKSYSDVNKTYLDRGTSYSKDLVEKTRKLGEEALNTTKEEYENTTKDFTTIFGKAREELQSQFDKQSENVKSIVKSVPVKMEESLKVLKDAGQGLKKTVISDAAPAKKAAPKKVIAKKAAPKKVAAAA